MDTRRLYDLELASSCRKASAEQAKASTPVDHVHQRDIDSTMEAAESDMELLHHVVGSLWHGWTLKKRVVYIVRIASHWPMTQTELANAMNSSQPSINRYENSVLTDIRGALSEY